MKTAKVSTKWTEGGNKARFSMGRKGQGSVTVEGTNEFVQKYQKLIAPAIDALFTEHVDAEVAKGRDRNEVLLELQAEMDKAAKKAGIKVDPRP